MRKLSFLARMRGTGWVDALMGFLSGALIVALYIWLFIEAGRPYP